MVARLIGLLLGLVIGAAGWIIIKPLGDVGPALPAIDLAQFEDLRALIGWGALGLGALAIVVNLMPGDRSTKRSASAAKPLSFADDAPATPVFNPAPEAPLTLAPEPTPAPAPVATPVRRADLPPVAPGPDPSGPPQETFGQLRATLRNVVREENWSEAGTILKRLPALALTHHDRMAAAQDLGDFCRGQGRVEDASEAYGQSLSYARLLHEIEPEDPVTAADLAGALINVGDMACDEGRVDAGLGAYEEAVALRRRLVSDNGNRRLERRALSIALERLADAREDRGHRVRALDLYRESLELAGHLAAEDPQRFGAELQSTRTRLSELESRLSV
jgi:hypothetical protein